MCTYNVFVILIIIAQALCYRRLVRRVGRAIDILAVLFRKRYRALRSPQTLRCTPSHWRACTDTLRAVLSAETQFDQKKQADK